MLRLAGRSRSAAPGCPPGSGRPGRRRPRPSGRRSRRRPSPGPARQHHGDLLAVHGHPGAVAVHSCGSRSANQAATSPWAVAVVSHAIDDYTIHRRRHPDRVRLFAGRRTAGPATSACARTTVTEHAACRIAYSATDPRMRPSRRPRPRSPTTSRSADATTLTRHGRRGAVHRVAGAPGPRRAAVETRSRRARRSATASPTPPGSRSVSRRTPAGRHGAERSAARRASRTQLPGPDHVHRAATAGGVLHRPLHRGLAAGRAVVAGDHAARPMDGSNSGLVMDMVSPYPMRYPNPPPPRTGPERPGQLVRLGNRCVTDECAADVGGRAPLAQRAARPAAGPPSASGLPDTDHQPGRRAGQRDRVQPRPGAGRRRRRRPPPRAARPARASATASPQPATRGACAAGGRRPTPSARRRASRCRADPVSAA